LLLQHCTKPAHYQVTPHAPLPTNLFSYFKVKVKVKPNQIKRQPTFQLLEDIGDKEQVSKKKVDKILSQKDLQILATPKQKDHIIYATK